ncbi:MAG: hypothetical protein IJR46_05355 [Neisseriaceae bacterium]|nr:hypothetical protein [Neisseriaceae bacterium]
MASLRYCVIAKSYEVRLWQSPHLNRVIAKLLVGWATCCPRVKPFRQPETFI